MNETTSPHTTPQGGAQQTQFGDGFFAWLRRLGINRSSDRWFAGVAGGIAARANIDPIIVRGVFIVLAILGGPGILLYLAGWLLLPNDNGKIHLEEVFRGRSGAAAVILTVAVSIFIVVPVFARLIGFGSAGIWGLWNFIGIPRWITITFTVLVWIAVLIALAVLLSRFLQRRGSGTAADASGTAASAAADISDTARAAATEAAAGVQTAAEHIKQAASSAVSATTTWGKDAGKRAEEWGQQYTAKPKRRGIGTAHTIITIALALLTAGSGALLTLSMGADNTFIVTTALLGATAVLALSLIIAGVRGRSTGWIGFLSFCGVIALLFTSVLPAGTRFLPFGSLTLSPPDTGSALIGGLTQVDLSALDTTPTTQDIEVWQAFGSVKVTLPKEQAVVVTVRILVGSSSAPDTDGTVSRTSGPLITNTVDTRIRPSEAATRVTIYVLTGTVDITGERATRADRPTDIHVGGISDQRTNQNLEYTQDTIRTAQKELVS